MYTSNAHPLQHRDAVIGQFLTLAKSQYGQGVISGSTADVKLLVHKKDSNDTRHSNFANLNNSVYRDYKLTPARTKEKLRDVSPFLR